MGLKVSSVFFTKLIFTQNQSKKGRERVTKKQKDSWRDRDAEKLLNDLYKNIDNLMLILTPLLYFFKLCTFYIFWCWTLLFQRESVFPMMSSVYDIWD